MSETLDIQPSPYYLILCLLLASSLCSSFISISLQNSEATGVSILCSKSDSYLR